MTDNTTDDIPELNMQSAITVTSNRGGHFQPGASLSGSLGTRSLGACRRTWYFRQLQLTSFPLEARFASLRPVGIDSVMQDHQITADPV